MRPIVCLIPGIIHGDNKCAQIHPLEFPLLTLKRREIRIVSLGRSNFRAQIAPRIRPLLGLTRLTCRNKWSLQTLGIPLSDCLRLIIGCIIGRMLFEAASDNDSLRLYIHSIKHQKLAT